MKYPIWLSILMLTAFFGCSSCNNNADHPVEDKSIFTPHKEGSGTAGKIAYSIIAEFPHDTSAYTQGLQLYNGKMYEGTGDYEASSLRITNYKTGKVEQIHKMGSKNIFGEGITIFKNKIYQLTWQSKVVYVYDLNDISKPIKTFTWNNEGWGITHNGTDLIVSTGSSGLFFVDPETFRIKSTINVTENNEPVENLNELEWVDGFVFANIYQTNDIVKIDPTTGFVVGKMNFDALYPRGNDYVQGQTDYFNGIAYDSTTKSMFITGKRWPKMWEIKLTN